MSAADFTMQPRPVKTEKHWGIMWLKAQGRGGNNTPNPAYKRVIEVALQETVTLAAEKN